MMKTVVTGNVTLGGNHTPAALPIMGRTETEVLEMAAHAADTPAEIIEFRADALIAGIAAEEADLKGDAAIAAGEGTAKEDAYIAAGEKAQKDNMALPERRVISILQTLLPKVRDLLPDRCLLFTLRTAFEGGEAAVTEEQYTEILNTAAKSGCVDLIDVEAFFGCETPERPEAVSECARRLLNHFHDQNIPVLFSNHDFSSAPENAELFRRMTMMRDAGCDIAKIACMPENAMEAARIAAISTLLRECLGIPHLLIAMGEQGRGSRMHAGLFGSAFSFGALPGRESAPGQIDIRELSECLRKDERRIGHIFLTGFMGCGKSTAARILTELSGRPSAEMDALIELREKKSISEIFLEKGEVYFRDAETAFLVFLADCDGMIISTGGGVPLRAENAALMRALGRCVFLSTEPSELYKRLTGESESRPNIRDRMSVEGIEELLSKRLPYYESAADLVISTDGRTPREIAEELNISCCV